MAEQKAKKAVDAAKEAVGDWGEKAKKGVETARARVQAVSGEVGEKVGETYAKASKVAKERYAETSETLRTGYTKVRKDLDGLTHDVTEYVKDNPGKSVLIAAGVGFLVGLVFRPRHGDE